MPIAFDPGYVDEPFSSLVASYPGAIAYPGAGFRLEWGPVFHRGRLDGSARVLVIGQDPAQHETIARRILVGEAGHRLQGFLFKLGIDRSYVMVNTFLYSVFGSASKNAKATRIITYRNKWLDAVFAREPIEAVVALGGLADAAWQTWAATAAGQAVSPAYQHITHPTAPESGAAHKQGDHAALITKMLANWNAGLQALAPAIAHPDKKRKLVLYGDAFADGDKKPIPMDDLPAGSPQWMATDDGWADRDGTGRRKTIITVTAPKTAVPA
jgi:uracil-DNA glycosylase